MKRISTIIVTYNSEKDIYDYNSYITKHADIPLLYIEFIIVINNSKEPNRIFSKIKDIYGDDTVLIKTHVTGWDGQGNNGNIRRATPTRPLRGIPRKGITHSKHTIYNRLQRRRSTQHV